MCGVDPMVSCMFSMSPWFLPLDCSCSPPLFGRRPLLQKTSEFQGTDGLVGLVVVLGSILVGHRALLKGRSLHRNFGGVFCASSFASKSYHIIPAHSRAQNMTSRSRLAAMHGLNSPLKHWKMGVEHTYQTTSLKSSTRRVASLLRMPPRPPNLLSLDLHSW